MIKTDFQPQTWAIEETGNADVYRIVKADKSDWIAVLRCAAIHNPGFQSGDGITNVKVMVAAPEMLEALKDAKMQIIHLQKNLSEKRFYRTKPTTTECLNLIDKAIEKALQ